MMSSPSAFLQFQELQLQRESLLASNRGLAEESLARRPPLNTGKLQLAEKYRQLSDLTTVCREKRKQLGKQEAPRSNSERVCMRLICLSGMAAD